MKKKFNFNVKILVVDKRMLRQCFGISLQSNYIVRMCWNDKKQ